MNQLSKAGKCNILGHQSVRVFNVMNMVILPPQFIPNKIEI